MHTTAGIFYTVHNDYLLGHFSYELSNLSVALISLGIYLGWRTWLARRKGSKK